MTYTARQLITDAYYLSQIVPQEGETVSGAQIESGLALLNDILAVMRVDVGHIPYYESKEFYTVPGQEKYFIENLISVETVTFNLDTVRFATTKVTRDAYFGQSRIDTLKTLPINYHLERAFDGTNIYFYPQPDKAYLIRLFGKVWIDEVAEDDDIGAFFDRFYLVYLKYRLAAYICNSYAAQLPEQVMMELNRLSLMTVDTSPKDLTIKSASPFNGGAGTNWGYINFNKGISP